MIGGGARVARDVPPFTMMTERDELMGLNVVGLRRRGLPRQTLEELKRAFRTVNVPVGNLRELATAALASGAFSSAEARRFLEFYASGKRGFVRVRRSGAAVDTEEQGGCA